MAEETEFSKPQQSIHPRVVGGVTRFEKVNTCKPHKGKGKLAKKMTKLNARRNANSISQKGSKNPDAFKTPGSMNQHKYA